MSSRPTTEVAETLAQIRHWPTAIRIELARQILNSLEPLETDDPPAPPPTSLPLRGVSAKLAYGMLRTDAPPATDEECRQIIEDERWRRYGIPDS